jgi:hypothetical protein
MSTRNVGSYSTRAGAGDNTDLARGVDVPRHDPDLALTVHGGRFGRQAWAGKAGWAMGVNGSGAHPGLMMPGQLGPIRRDLLWLSSAFFTFTCDACEGAEAWEEDATHWTHWHCCGVRSSEKGGGMWGASWWQRGGKCRRTHHVLLRNSLRDAYNQRHLGLNGL